MFLQKGNAFLFSIFIIFGLSLSNCAQITEHSYACPDKFENLATGCFYIERSEKIPWISARHRCQKMAKGAELANLTQSEMQLLDMFIIEKGLQKVQPISGFWLNNDCENNQDAMFCTLLFYANDSVSFFISEPCCLRNRFICKAHVLKPSDSEEMVVDQPPDDSEYSFGTFLNEGNGYSI